MSSVLPAERSIPGGRAPSARIAPRSRHAIGSDKLSKVRTAATTKERRRRLVHPSHVTVVVGYSDRQEQTLEHAPNRAVEQPQDSSEWIGVFARHIWALIAPAPRGEMRGQ